MRWLDPMLPNTFFPENAMIPIAPRYPFTILEG